MDMENDRLILKDYPSGPFDFYRKQASFDWRKLKLFIEDEELLKMRLRVWKTLENEPLFHKDPVELMTDEKKRLTALRLRKYLDYEFVDTNAYDYRKRTRLLLACNEALAMTFPEVSIKHALGYGLFSNTIITLGTERHRKFAYAGNKMLSCLALTEIAHGSNTKQMRTKATYDAESEEFIIETPDFEAAKCWIGNLGKQCTHALLFAQLYTKNQCHGLHAFVIPVRDPSTLQPYPGIILGDMGEKIGLHGIDNGFIMFNNYRVPKESLLNRIADLTAKGEYESKFTEPNRILGAALENLSMGRVGIIQESSNNLIMAVTIAVRYGAIRKQFAPNNNNNGDCNNNNNNHNNGNGNGKGDGSNEELPIIEYLLHQWRLFPYMSAAVVLRIFVNEFTETYLSVIEKSASENTELENLSEMVSEMHALVSAVKPLLTWTCLWAVQECREACGGHGFLRSARLGDLRTTIDPCVTYEGDNNVLSQQTSNWLLRKWKENGGVPPLLGSCDFFSERFRIQREKYGDFGNGGVTNEKFVIDAYKWLLVYLIRETDDLQKKLLNSGCDRFKARNQSQVYRASVLSRVFAEYTALRYYYRKLRTIKKSEGELRPVLEKMGSLYGLWCLDKHLVYFYEGEYASNGDLSKHVKNGILELCESLKGECLGVVDGIAPPDWVVDSVLGRSDGKLYENLQNSIMHAPGALSRPDWWKEITCNSNPVRSKL